MAGAGVAVLLCGPAASPQSRKPVPSAPALAADGEFVWHDLVTDKPAASRAFYGSLFGWTFEAGRGVDPGYTLIKHDGFPIGGIVPRPAAADGTFIAQWLSYVVVANVDDAVGVITHQGGQVIRGPLNARRDLRVAVVADPQGAAIGLASRGPKVAAAALPELHRWLWMEYMARDAAAALAFYSKAIGFRHEISDTRDDFTYYVLHTDRPRAGLLLSPWTQLTSAWLPYVRVADPAAMAARAVALGGTLVVPPQPSVRNASLAIIVDPAGAPLALQKFPFDAGGK
jgi:predicted enzyme related to lactoylglutathione lyase